MALCTQSVPFLNYDDDNMIGEGRAVEGVGRGALYCLSLSAYDACVCVKNEKQCRGGFLTQHATAVLRYIVHVSLSGKEMLFLMLKHINAEKL